MILPLFPLPIFLLPAGVTQLRIFEQRYLTMIKNANKTDGFIIGYANNDDEISNWGSWVDIIDFDTGDDGMLNILVRCKKLVKVSQHKRQQDKLITVKATPLLHWPEINSNKRCIPLRTQLQQLFKQHDTLNKLYATPAFYRDDWVVARWLELLPVSFENKKLFVHPNSFISAVDFLTTVILEENNLIK